MQPTTNTPFERWAFVAVIAITAAAVAAVAFQCFGSIVCILIDNGRTTLPRWTENVCTMIIFLFLIANTVGAALCAFKIGRDHLRALDQAEAELSDVIVSDTKTLPANWRAEKTFFVMESVVLSNDYLNNFFWFFRRFIGGESAAFSKLLARSRREAAVRVLRKAKAQGANVVWNIRFETSTILSNWSKRTDKLPVGVEVLAYATAFFVTEKES